MKICKAIIISVGSLAIITSCMNSESKHSKTLKSVEEEHIKNQRELNELFCSCIGGGGNGEQVKHISIEFDTKKTLTINDARRLLVDGVLDLQKRVNSEPTLKNHFQDWPVPFENIDYSIHSVTETGYWPIFQNGLNPNEEISYIQHINGKVKYLIKIDIEKLPQTIHSERLEEAIAILKAEGWTEPK